MSKQASRLIALGIIVVIALIISLPLLLGNSGQDNATLLKAAVHNMRAMHSYHVESDDITMQLRMRSSWDVDADKSNLAIKANVAGRNIQLITIGHDTYVSTDGGVSFTTNSTISLLSSGFKDYVALWGKISDAEVDNAKELLADGNPSTETIDGVATKHIATSTKALPSFGSSSAGNFDGTVDIWISTEGAPTVRQVHSVGKVQALGNSSSADSTDKWSDFNKPVSIKAPDMSK